jgi:hypothetical protein
MTCVWNLTECTFDHLTPQHLISVVHSLCSGSFLIMMSILTVDYSSHRMCWCFSVVLHCRNTWLHRSGSVPPNRIRKGMWLVVTWSDYVRMFGRLSSFLCRRPNCYLSKNRKLEEIVWFPARRNFESRSRRSHSKVLTDWLVWWRDMMRCGLLRCLRWFRKHQLPVFRRGVSA